MRPVGTTVPLCLRGLVHAPAGLLALPVTLRASPAADDEGDDADHHESHEDDPSKHLHGFSLSAPASLHMSATARPAIGVLRSAAPRRCGYEIVWGDGNPPIPTAEVYGRSCRWLAAAVFLDLNGHPPELADDEAFDLVTAVADGTLDVDAIAGRLSSEQPLPRHADGVDATDVLRHVGS